MVLESASGQGYEQHRHTVQQWLQAHQARGELDPLTHEWAISRGARQFRLVALPSRRPGRFAGWLPELPATWPAAQDRVTFKCFAAAAGLHTPKWARDIAGVTGAYLVKPRRTDAEGRQGRGPFMAPGHQALAEGEFAEQFVAGRGLTAWFWNGKLAAAEFTDQPGDDARSAIHSTTVEAQLARAGSLCWSAVPPRIRPGCAFVLHAVVAPNGSTWLLELNAEAALTPAFYATLLADLLPSP